MNDTSPEMERIVTERYRQITPEHRMRIASSMLETARKAIESSLPPNLSRRERRLALARRLYEGELPEGVRHTSRVRAVAQLFRDDIPVPTLV